MNQCSFHDIFIESLYIHTKKREWWSVWRSGVRHVCVTFRYKPLFKWVWMGGNCSWHTPLTYTADQLRAFNRDVDVSVPRHGKLFLASGSGSWNDNVNINKIYYYYYYYYTIYIARYSGDYYYVSLSLADMDFLFGRSGPFVWLKWTFLFDQNGFGQHGFWPNRHWPI